MTEPEEAVPSVDWSDEQKWSFLIRNERLGELLVKKKLLTLKRLEELLEIRHRSGKHIGEVIVEQRVLTLDEIVGELKQQMLISQECLESVEELKTRKRAET